MDALLFFWLLINGALNHNVFSEPGLFWPCISLQDNNLSEKIKLFDLMLQNSRVLQILSEIKILLKILLANFKVSDYGTGFFNQQKNYADLFSRILWPFFSEFFHSHKYSEICFCCAGKIESRIILSIT
jgi:hypothetical protein